MSSAGRFIGHGLGAFFMVLGAFLLVLGLSDSFTALQGSNSCTGAGCAAADSARATLVTVGITFFLGGLLTSALTEFGIRKARRIQARVTRFSANPGDPEAVSEFLRDFGIDMDLSRASVTVGQPVTVDLRGQRTGPVPTEPSELSDYLRSKGVNISADVLARASIIQHGRVIQAGTPDVQVAPEPVGFTTATPSSESLRESATIIRKHDRGSTAGNQRLLELEIEVSPVGKAPYRVTVASLVRESLVNLLIEGSTLNVRVNPHDRNDVTIDWAEN